MMLAYLKFELRRMYREPRLIIFTIAMPVIIFLGTSSAYSTDDAAETRKTMTFLMVAWAAYGAMIGTFSTGVGVSQERSSGWLRQLRITPLPPLRVVVIKAIAATLVAIPAVIVVSLIGGLVKGVEMDATQWISLVALMWLGSAPFALLGLALGFLLPPQLAPPASFLITFTLAFAGGIFLPLDMMPSGLAAAARWMPSYRFAEFGWSVLDKQAPPMLGVAIVIGWTVVFALFASLTYRRSAAQK
ncbi:ABC-2 type transport system permease protein [Allocatelliglobosispora scoriae]|uniref:ABC-2 type transport system permease protein n=1 Tax=Allocatelliglobosispora scoriae TaxID=643052 RepID=A0A841BVI9_9ACTN|nr:ABC transporter permease [Allocatelliglobosispora scoriae]MBB5870933.1 ABC-2 type transport system permease protein [Allocatelliglobosispora scoriae]